MRQNLVNKSRYMLLHLFQITACVVIWHASVIQALPTPAPSPLLTIDDIKSRASVMRSNQAEVYNEFIILCTRSKAYCNYLSKETGLLDKALSRVNAEDALWYAARTVDFDDMHLKREYGHLAKLAGYVGMATNHGGERTLVAYDDMIMAFFFTAEHSREDTMAYNVGELLPNASPTSSKVVVLHGNDYLG